jgi:hypothetical protein
VLDRITIAQAVAGRLPGTKSGSRRKRVANRA